MRVALDTNVLVSALIADGPPSRLLRRLASGPEELLLLEPVEVELVRVLATKLGWSAERIAEARRILGDAATARVVEADGVVAATGDPDDDLILATALAGGADVLASGDRKHLLPVGEHRGLRILTPQALLAELAVRG